jgi:hypothetical protein
MLPMPPHLLFALPRRRSRMLVLLALMCVATCAAILQLV